MLIAPLFFPFRYSFIQRKAYYIILISENTQKAILSFFYARAILFAMFHVKQLRQILYTLWAVTLLNPSALER